MIRVLLVLLGVAAFLPTASSLASEPSSDEIPIIGQRFAPWGWSPLLLCQLAWSHFDGFEVQLAAWEGYVWTDFLEQAGISGLHVIITPTESYELSHIDNNEELNRAHYGSLGTGSAFITVDQNGANILDTFTASDVQDELEEISADLIDAYSDYDALWCWKLMDEAPTSQRGRMFTSAPYDQYYPNMFPCQYPADTTMARTDSASVYSWLKWIMEHEDTEHPTTTVFAGMPKITSAQPWAWFHHDPGVPHADTHADIVRAFAGMRYQDYPVVNPPNVYDNFPEMLQVDIYPFRQVGIEYQDSMSYTPELGDDLYIWLLNHAETGMDSTFFPAVDEGLSLHYFPQAFGVAGGSSMWMWHPEDSTYSLNYATYTYRIPSPAEFRMLCNVALLRQAKGIFPYSLMSYPEGDPPRYSASLLDYNMIPWDAPFEEYCYTNRSQDSLDYIRPDYYPPFQDGFDPLYEGPGLPPGISGERGREAFLEWKFAPYARLWNSLRETLGGIATIAPELAGLYWYDGDGSPGCPDAFEVIPEYPCNLDPEGRVFWGDGHYYMFYVNRCCMDSVQTYDVGYYAGGVLPAPETGVLDHNRRVLIPLWEWDTDYYGYCDTLGPGEARLVELIDEEEPVDLRITSPDVYTLIGQSIVPRYEFACTAGDTVGLYGTFYNLGTEDAEDVDVTFTDLTTSTVLGRDTLEFAGLSWENPRETDDDTAGLSWITDSGDIGMHLLQIEAERVGSENRLDNSVSVPVLIQPRDYATAVRGDPWDMMESGDSAWHTNDIEAIDGDWLSSAWTDSITGMFEGALDHNSLNNPIPGRISLAIPSQSGRWIDSDVYKMLSFAGVWYTPDYIIGTKIPTFVRWRDSYGTYSEWHNISDAINTLHNGWTTFHTSGPIDLSTISDQYTSWSDGPIQELWLTFQMGKPHPTTSDPQIRLSWVRLEESGD
jgi:hypothetical protein